MRTLKQMMNISVAVTVLVVGLVITTSANAAQITWSNAVTTVDDTSVIYDGLDDPAGLSFGAASAGVTPINGVPFVNTTSGNGTTVLANGISLTRANYRGGATLDTQTWFSELGGQLGIILDTSCQGLNNGTDGSTTNTISGLTIGQEYKIQIFTSRLGGWRIGTQYLADSDGPGLEYNGNAEMNIVATFTADATTQEYLHYIVGNRSNLHFEVLSAFVIGEVPEVPVSGTIFLIM
jgi:hypothetical protein